MDSLGLTANIIALLDLTTSVIAHLHHVRDASKDLMRIALEAANLYSLLFQLNYHIQEGDFDEQWYTATYALAVRNGPLDQFRDALQELEKKLAGQVDNSMLSKLKNALVWTFNEEEIADITSRMERLKTLVQTALEMDHLKLSQVIKSDTAMIRNVVLAVETTVDTIKEGQDREEYQYLLQWLSSAQYPAQQSDLIANKQKRTGRWFLKCEEFSSWLTKPRATLFCTGMPGAGKTMMAAITIDHLSNRRIDGGLAYIYCDYKQSEQNATGLLSALLKQLLQDKPFFAMPLKTLHDVHIKKQTRPSLEEIFHVLQSVVSKYACVYMVVDALDECEEGDRTQLLAKLEDLQKNQDVHLMLTSRLQITEGRFQHSIHVEIGASRNDVGLYIAGQIENMPRCIQKDPELWSLVQTKIAKAVKGMFLLARLYLYSLRDKTTKKLIKATLEQISQRSWRNEEPNQVYDEVYEEAIERIEGQLEGRSRLARKVLSWITYAKRPLTTDELCHALAVEEGTLELDAENIPDIEDMVAVCAGLVAIDKKRNVVRLVHYTAHAYLKRIRKEWVPEAERDIATTCLTYLSFDAFKYGSCPTNKSFDARLNAHVFLEYAALYWEQHTRRIQGQMLSLALPLLLSQARVSLCLQVVQTSDFPRTDSNSSQSFLTAATGLHLAASSALTVIVRELLTIPAVAADARDDDGDTPLIWAVQQEHISTVRVLIAHANVDINARNKDGQTALHFAVRAGFLGTVRLLIENGADVNCEDKYRRTPLSVAALHGHKTVVQALLEDAANTNHQNVDGATPLYLAAEEGQHAVVQVILGHSAVFHGQKIVGKTPAPAAAEDQEALKARLPFVHDVDVNLPENEGQTPLMASSQNGHQGTVWLLLGNENIDVNRQNNQGQTALLLAIRSKDRIIAKMLLERDDIVVNLRSHRGQSPLIAAVRKGCIDLVGSLLKRGDVDIDAQDDKGRSAIWWAAHLKKPRTFELLKEKGARLPEERSEAELPRSGSTEETVSTSAKDVKDDTILVAEEQDEEETNVISAGESDDEIMTILGEEVKDETVLDSGELVDGSSISISGKRPDDAIISTPETESRDHGVSASEQELQDKAITTFAKNICDEIVSGFVEAADDEAISTSQEKLEDVTTSNPAKEVEEDTMQTSGTIA